MAAFRYIRAVLAAGFDSFGTVGVGTATVVVAFDTVVVPFDTVVVQHVIWTSGRAAVARMGDARAARGIFLEHARHGARARRAAVKACPERGRRIDPQLAAKARELRDR